MYGIKFPYFLLFRRCFIQILAFHKWKTIKPTVTWYALNSNILISFSYIWRASKRHLPVWNRILKDKWKDTSRQPVRPRLKSEGQIVHVVGDSSGVRELRYVIPPKSSHKVSKSMSPPTLWYWTRWSDCGSKDSPEFVVHVYTRFCFLSHLPQGPGLLSMRYRQVKQEFHNTKDSLKAALMDVMTSKNENHLIWEYNRFRGSPSGHSRVWGQFYLITFFLFFGYVNNIYIYIYIYIYWFFSLIFLFFFVF